MKERLLRSYISEVLSGFRSLNTTGSERAAGNLRYSTQTTAQKNRGILDDISSIEQREKQDVESGPRAACVLIIAEDGKVLSVSRKNDPTDFGLPGGKVDYAESDAEAAIRELKEETGLTVARMKKVFEDTDSTGYFTTTFFAEVTGEINTPESGVIKWVDPKVLMTSSSFAEYNRKLFKRVGLV